MGNGDSESLEEHISTWGSAHNQHGIGVGENAAILQAEDPRGQESKTLPEVVDPVVPAVGCVVEEWEWAWKGGVGGAGGYQ